MKLSKLVERLSGFRLAANKPIVGDRVFTRESGIAVAGWMKYHLGSEAFLPELVGNRYDVLVGKKGGKHSLGWKLKQLSVEAIQDEIQILLETVKERYIAKKGPVEDAELLKTIRIRAGH